MRLRLRSVPSRAGLGAHRLSVLSSLPLHFKVRRAPRLSCATARFYMIGGSPCGSRGRAPAGSPAPLRVANAPRVPRASPAFRCAPRARWARAPLRGAGRALRARARGRYPERVMCPAPRGSPAAIAPCGAVALMGDSVGNPPSWSIVYQLKTSSALRADVKTR